MSDTPISNGESIHRTGTGRPRGNPNLQVWNRNRASLYRSFKISDAKKSVQVMVSIFRDETISPSVRLAAATAYQTRFFGTPGASELLERLERVEQKIEGERRNGNGRI